MVTDAILSWLAGSINSLMAALPSWNLQLTSCQAPPPYGWDNGYFCGAVDFFAQYDHFLPIHDGFFPVFLFGTSGVAGFLAIRLVLIIINVIRGAGA